MGGRPPCGQGQRPGVGKVEHVNGGVGRAWRRRRERGVLGVSAQTCSMCAVCAVGAMGTQQARAPRHCVRCTKCIHAERGPPRNRVCFDDVCCGSPLTRSARCGCSCGRGSGFLELAHQSLTSPPLLLQSPRSLQSSGKHVLASDNRSPHDSSLPKSLEVSSSLSQLHGWTTDGCRQGRGRRL